MANRALNYEVIRNEISALEKTNDSSDRKLVWLTAEHSLAVSRDTAGRLEVFVPGEPLVAATRTVAEVLEHQVWRAEDGAEIAATRVVLPTGEHFDQFGSLLCVELVDHGLFDDPQSAFAAVEPLVALSLTRDTVTDLTLIGLIGELALLEALMASSVTEAVRGLLDSWAGSAPSARDFGLGSVGVEVKTTQGTSSIHHVEGVHQIELGHSNEDVIETDLFLLSLGIGWTDDQNQGRSLPELIDSLLGYIDDVDDRERLLARIKQYGGDAALGYEHERDSAKGRYSRRFYFRFERLYDMTDERLKLLTSESLAGMANVDPGSVKFRVVLKDRIRGDLNPATGMEVAAVKVLARGGFPLRYPASPPD